jgi:hypothetical protein
MSTRGFRDVMLFYSNHFFDEAQLRRQVRSQVQPTTAGWLWERGEDEGERSAASETGAIPSATWDRGGEELMNEGETKGRREEAPLP